MLKSLTIQRFRGISHLNLDDFGRVNIFIGVNGVGKTTVLESLFILGQPNSPGTIVTLGQWRDMPPLNAECDDAIRSIFHNGNLELCPEFIFWVGNERQVIELVPSVEPIEKTVNIPTSDTLNLGSGGSSTSSSSTGLGQRQYTESFVYGLTSVFHPNDKDHYEGNLQLNQVGVQMNIPKPYRGMGCFFIQERRNSSPAETASILLELRRTNLAERFFRVLRKVSPQVRDAVGGLRANKYPVVFVDVGLPQMLPIGAVGDGFCRVALIATGLMSRIAELLVVDGIDTGLHMSVMGDMWKGISQISKEEGKQVFCSTHNEEMLSKTVDAFADDPEALRIFRIDRRDDGSTVATKYTYDEYCMAEHTNVDIR
jgi:hypothetical protein